MYNSDTDLLFPVRIISSLDGLRGQMWQELVRNTASAEEGHLDQLGFALMMVRLNGCVTCNSDSFRAMRGCTQCAMQNVRRFKGSDQDLLKQVEQARFEVAQYLAKKMSK